MIQDYYQVQTRTTSRMIQNASAWRAIKNARNHILRETAEEVARKWSKKFAGMSARVVLIANNETEKPFTVSTWYAGARKS